MKTIAKRLFATVIALALMCTMVTGFAANTASVTKVEVWDSVDDDQPTTYETLDGIEVVEGQIIKVYTSLTTTKVTGEGEEAVTQTVAAAGDMTFLSADFAEALGNDSIQYVAQKTVVDGETVFTFRPRATLSTGTFGAKVGGTDVAAAVAFDYDVVAALVPLSLSAANPGSIVENDDETDITFTVTGYAGGAVEVAIDENVLAEEQYEIEGNTLTIYNAAITKTVGTHTVTLSGAGYIAAESTFAVTEKPDVQLTLNAINGTVQENASENIEFAIVGYTEGDLAVTFTKNGETVDVEYEIEGNILKIKTKIVGEYTVSVEGEGYIADEATFTITAKPDEELTLSAASPTSIEVDDTTTNIVFTVGGIVAEQPITVALGEITLEAGTHYTLEDKTLTILNSTISKTIGTYTVTIDGKGYKAASATFDVVADSSVQLTLDGVVTSLQEDDEEINIVYTLGGYTEGELTVEIDGVVVAATVEGTTLTIANGALVKTLGTHNVRVSGVGYYAATAIYTVTKKPVTPDDPIVDEEVANDAQDAINNLDPEVSVNETTGVIESVTLQDKVEVGETEYNVTNDVVTSDSALRYDANTGVIRYNYDPYAEDARFVSKAVITTSISSTAGISKTETIYFIPKDAKISFGNVTAIATTGGKDAFAEENFEEYKNAPEALEAQTVALNVVLGRQGKNTIAQQEETLDYDQSGTITLSEYKIFRYMMLGKPGYSWSDVHGARDRWIEINGAK